MIVDYEKIARAVRDGNDQEAVRLAREAIEKGGSALDILDKGLVPGVQALGELFKEGHAYLPEILISTRAMQRALAVLQPHLVNVDIRKKGTIVNKE